MLLSDRKAFGKASLLIILVAVASTVFSIGYWVGFIRPSETQLKVEILSLTNMTSTLSGNTLTLGFLVKNNGTADARLEYIVTNETVITTGVKDKIIPYDSEAAISLQLDSSIFKPNTTVKLRLHTATGKDFTQFVTIPVTTSPYTGHEKVEITSVTVSKDAGSGNYTITFNLKNTGSEDAIVDMFYINGKTYDNAFADKVSVRELAGAWITSGLLNIQLESGSSKTVQVRIHPASGTATTAPFTSGTTLDMKFHTAAGHDYPQMITLT